MKLLNWLEIDYKIIDKKVITEHLVSVNLGLSDVEIVVKSYEWEDEKAVVQNAVSQFVRQAYPKIDKEIKTIEDKIYAEQNSPKESEEEKQADRTKLEEARDAWFKYFVNITTEDNAKHAVIHDIDVAIATMLEFDAERNDFCTKSLEHANKYAEIFNTDGEESAIKYKLSLDIKE